MRPRTLEIILIIAILLGGVLTWRTGRERGRLERQYGRLLRVTGDLPIADASRINALALEPGDPLHFAWRFYVPPNYRLRLRDNNGWGFGSSSSSAQEFIARVRFRENEDGRVEVYTRFLGSSSRLVIPNRSLTALLHGRWDRLRVEQYGAAHVETLETGRQAVVLRLTLPEEMRQEVAAKLPAQLVKRYAPVLYELKLGPESPQP